MTAAPVAVLIGAPVSEALLGLDGWTWAWRDGNGCSWSKAFRRSSSA